MKCCCLDEWNNVEREAKVLVQTKEQRVRGRLCSPTNLYIQKGVRWPLLCYEVSSACCLLGGLPVERARPSTTLILRRQKESTCTLFFCLEAAHISPIPPCVDFYSLLLLPSALPTFAFPSPPFNPSPCFSSSLSFLPHLSNQTPIIDDSIAITPNIRIRNHQPPRPLREKAPLIHAAPSFQILRRLARSAARAGACAYDGRVGGCVAGASHST